MAKKHDIRQIDEICRRVGLSKRLRELLHDEIHGMNYTYREILEIAKELKELYPNK